MSGHPVQRNKGFSLLELVIVVVIIGIIAAIAVPRMSRGSAGAADAALSGNLAILRNAIDLYAAEHGGTLPAKATVADQLTLYSDSAGTTASALGGAFIYGPYIRKIPPLPVSSARKGDTGISDAAAAGVGWIYDETTGNIQSNTTDSEQDASGTAYNTY